MCVCVCLYMGVCVYVCVWKIVTILNTVVNTFSTSSAIPFTVQGTAITQPCIAGDPTNQTIYVMADIDSAFQVFVYHIAYNNWTIGFATTNGILLQT